MQKSGYFSRSAAANERDLALIKSMTDLAVDCALRGEPGLIGHDEERGDELRAIEFDRIKGGKPFDISAAVVHRVAGRHRPAQRSARRRALTAHESGSSGLLCGRVPAAENTYASAAPNPTPVAAPVT